MKATNPIIILYRQMLVVVYNNQHCFYCDHGKLKPQQKDQKKGQFKTIDHIVPKALMGADKNYNTVTACNKCNSLKNDMSLEKWREIVSMGTDVIDTPGKIVLALSRIDLLISYRDLQGENLYRKKFIDGVIVSMMNFHGRDKLAQKTKINLTFVGP